MNTINYKQVIAAFLLLMVTVAVHAQQLKVIDSIGNKISLYGIKNQSPELFIHFDKNVYSTGEGVWFTAYLLNCVNLTAYKTLSVALVRDADKSVVSTDEFVLKNGFSFGKMFISNSIPPGNYSFAATTNRLIDGHPQLVFTQPVTIDKEDGQGYVAAPVYKAVMKDSIAQQPVVRFYPEGGSLVNNLQSTIGWEVKSVTGIPLGVSAVLYQDKKAIDTLSTNSYGLGRFVLKPKAGSHYTVKLYKQDSLCQLPVALTQGPVISLLHAVVNDTLDVNLKEEQPEKLYLIVHNYKQLFFTIPVTATVAGKAVKIVLNNIPKGLTQLTVVDSMGRPFAERLFFAHYDQKMPLNITPDKNEYATRQKVNVKIKINSVKSDSGLVSVACVQANRLMANKENDIESYFYLKHDLGDLPARETYLNDTEADKQFLENILLVKGWRRYTWTDMLKTKPADTLHKFEDITFKGKITKYIVLPLKKPVTIVSIVNPSVKVISDLTGNFMLNDTDLVTVPDKKLNFIVAENDQQNYQFQFSDPYVKVDQELAELVNNRYYDRPVQQDTFHTQSASDEHFLKEISINGQCNDYVCKDNYLNCPNHKYDRGNRKPVIGERYTIDFQGTTAVYTGCTGVNKSLPQFNRSVLQLKGIYAAQEFYQPDYSQMSPLEPQNLSTLYWKHQLKISSAKDAEISFNTGDITGKFKIVVQGVAGNDITYGESFFNVARSK